MSTGSWIMLQQLADIIIAHSRRRSYHDKWVPVGCVVDIGMGWSTHMLSEHARKWGVSQYSCDINPRRVTKVLHDKHIVHVGDSYSFMKKYDEQWNTDKPVLVFIDGCHLYDVVKDEYAFFINKIVNDGVIFLHDTNPKAKRMSSTGQDCGDVYRLRWDIEKDKSVQSFTWPYTADSAGLTMVMKRTPMRPPYIE